MIDTHSEDQRPTGQSLFRGFLHRCPNCAKGSLYRKYLKVVDTCSSCGEDLSHQRTDDAAPYFTILIVGHMVVPMALGSERAWHLSTQTHLMIWLPLIIILSLIILPCTKGAIVGIQWALRMHGFGGETDDPIDNNDKIRGT